MTSASATAKPARRTQADRRAKTHGALLEAAARGLSRYGYSNLVLERVAAEAGYTRGALYHLFAGKEDLALAVVEWVREAWYAEMGSLLGDVADPIGALIAVARRRTMFCRRDIARVMITLRVEFGTEDHPVGRKIREVERQLVADSAAAHHCRSAKWSDPSGTAGSAMARAYLGAVEGLVINLAGQAPFDVVLAERAVLGLLGLPPRPAPTSSSLRSPKGS